MADREVSTRPDLLQLLEYAEKVIRWMPDVLRQITNEPSCLAQVPEGQLHVGVDLGTACLVLVVLDQNRQQIADEYQFAQVARDSVVVDFIGAVDQLTEMKHRVEGRLGWELSHASSGYPPGGPQTAQFPGIAGVLEEYTGIPTQVPDRPLFVTPLWIAMHDRLPESMGRNH